MIRPYRRTPPVHPVGIVRADGRVVMEDGTVNRMDRTEPTRPQTRLFADRDLVTTRFLLRGRGKAVCWNGVPIRWLPDVTRKVILLPGYPGDGDDVLAGLVAWRDFLAEHGAAIGSAAASTLSLLRASLHRPIFTGRGDNGPSIPEVIGGRQEAFAPQGRYGSFAHYDLRAAYARTLGDLDYYGSWAPWPYDELPHPDSGIPCLVRARIRFPKGLTHGPLPRRLRAATSAFVRSTSLREYPTIGRMVGLFERTEIEGAIEADCGISVERAWAHTGPGERRPFERWWTWIEEGRKLPGYASTLAKTAGNALWSTFIAEGERTLTKYEAGEIVKVEPMPLGRLPEPYRGTDVAELVTARVRARLYRELIAPHADRLISVHTDGGLLAAGDEPSLPADWRRKHGGDDLVFLSPACYRFRHDQTKQTVHVMAGTKPADQRVAFDSAVRAFLGGPATGGISEHAKGLHVLVENFPELADQIRGRKTA